MKKFLALLLCLLLTSAFVACGTTSSQGNSTSSETTPSTSQETSTNMTEMEFQELLQKQPLTIINSNYIVQDEQYKTLYPDVLQVTLQNNTEADIKNAVVAFVAWDENNLPVKIKGSIDFSDGAYIQQVNYSDINLIGGATFGENSGYTIDEACNISKFTAIPVSFETFEGDTWENPYFSNFCTLYEGQKYTDNMTVEVKIIDDSFKTSSSSSKPASASSANLSASELESELAKQPLIIIGTNYVVQDEQYKTLYPDMLQVILQNNTDSDIKNAVVAFVAWDKNNLPVKIKGSTDFSDGAYIQQVNYSDINLVNGATFGENSGYSIDQNCGITQFKAIVVSYETFEGDTWENPYYNDFRTLYEGQRLQ